ncbi:MAG: YceI family protein [Planctomycetales bacterium]|nr:YceI family protein [Planctomycetales bacterium]
MPRLLTATLLALVTASSFTAAAAAAQPLKADLERSKISFVGGKPDGSTHDGGFKKFKIDAQADLEQPSNSSLRIEIQTASLFADNPKLEGHLKNPDFFDVRKYPTAVFESTKIEAGEHEGTIVGKLKLLDKVEEITVPVKIEHSDEATKLTAKFKLDRARWGMRYGLEGNKINREVEITAVLHFQH